MLADTVVLTHPSPGISSTPFQGQFGRQEILEKPEDKEDNLRMLLDLNGGVCEVVTGVSLGRCQAYKFRSVIDVRFSVSCPRSTWI